ncbi:cadherin-19 isoform X2 [Microtus ochrogaster]|uniref:Cadherin-19 isoform X2 n=1 Tax=Microtus ochrogaster TaxID=79684 RepID=A0ABM1UV35_MICOH|nr:cadherin-19 isoform X2 [Microtus ochrogaster]
MNSCFLKHWILVILLLWPFLKVTENFQARKTQRSASSIGRAKRGWVWNQFAVPEEMDTRQHVGRLISELDNGNRTFQYKLLETGAGSFSIDERTGDIFAIRKLNREEQSLYILRAQVIDSTTGKAVEPESEFVIRVLDINDNEPKFLDEPYEATVPEMSPEGTFVIKVTANDADDPTTGYYARILYNLVQGQPYFSVEPTTGFYRFSVLESAPSGTSIGKIMAYDDDIGENAEMEYIIEEDDSQTFDIITDNETQEGIIILKKKVDFEHQSHYGFRVKVKNCHVDEELASAHVNSSSTYIKVQVEDEDEPPVFLLPYYVFGIPEEKPYGSIVGTVSAIDMDRKQSPIRYSLTGSKLFDINDNGTIITTNVLDREVSAWFNLSVLATETYNVQQISSIPVYVQVFNINDHAPEFYQYYETYVCENAEFGEIIQTISAIDRDESIEHHHFYFNHSVEDRNNSSFILRDNQDNTAVILTNRMGFSLKDEPVLSMIILISDNGIPSLTSTNTLTIQVCDCGESASTEMCTKRGLLLIMRFKTEVIIAILVCIMVIFGFIFLMLAMKQRRNQILFPKKSEEFGENIFCYDDEGGGEEDSEAFDISELRSSIIMRERKPRKRKSMEIRSLYRQSLLVGPESAVFRQFILEKLEEANTDPCAPPFDSLQTFAFEGTGSSAGSLSSLESIVTDQEDNIDYLNDLGPHFKRLAYMFGSAMQLNN